MDVLAQNSQDLNDREQTVLRYIIEQYLLTAFPIGSRTLSKQLTFTLSPASIRNIMSDLEEKGLIAHPHTSAGRIPTDKGYRYYVDSIMQVESIRESDREMIEQQLDTLVTTDINDIMRHTSVILGSISKQLAIVSAPQIGSGILDRIELVHVSSSRIMIILSVTSGLVRTIILETEAEVRREHLNQISGILNERLAGLTLREIRESLPERVMDAGTESTDLIRLFINSSDRLFAERPEHDALAIEGITGIMQQPEFNDPERLRNFINLIQNQNVIFHILNSINDEQSMTIRIGREIAEENLSSYSLVSTPYRIGSLTGAMSIFGLKRMDYPRMISILNYISRIISQ
jgi:heat-inducible transcriptional repressor